MTDIVRLSAGRRILLALLICAGAAALGGPSGRLVVVMPVLLLGPGYLAEQVLRLPREPGLLRLALWLGLSLSLISLVYLWLGLFGVALTTPRLAIVAVLIGATALVLVWRELGGATRDRRQETAALTPHASRPRLFASSPPRLTTLVFSPQPSALSPWFGSRLSALLVLIFGLTLWVRFVEIEGLALPPWVDSVHHALMVRVAAERGMAPSSLEPYLPIVDLPYHWGYHVVAAAMLQLSGLRLEQLMLWSGQILNALHAPLAGALALALWRRPSAAVAASLIVGLVSIMPAYYVSWGRYTQLTGLLLLPSLAIAWLAALNRGSPRWWAAAALVLAGLSLIHFRVLIYGLALIATISAMWAIRASPDRLRAAVLRAFLSGLSAIALTIPWLVTLARRTLLPTLSQPESLVMGGMYNALSLNLLYAGTNRLLIALAGLAAFWGLWRRRQAVAIILSWVSMLLLMANPSGLSYVLPLIGAPLLVLAVSARRFGLALLSLLLLLGNPWLLHIPGTWLINNDTIVISLFLPISVLIGGGASELIDWARRGAGPRLHAYVTPLAVVICLIVAGWGGWQLREVVNKSTIFAGPADLAAIEWVAANTAPDTRFLINATPWLGVANRGVDGGWWLMPLAGRWTSTPPAIFFYGPIDYVQATIDRGRLISGFKPGQEQAIFDIIKRDRIDYLYFGPDSGPLKPEQFAGRPGFRSVYSRDGVTILAVESIR